MRLSDLRDKRVRTLDGQSLGRVHEVHCEKGKIVALMTGSASLIERLTARTHGRRIPWECVMKIDAKQVTVAPDPPQRKPAKKKPSASRSRQGTRRASARRSKR
ncbi:MAG TPA: PRC-barrel domain-containing protein [Sphingomicrobium sp.]